MKLRRKIAILLALLLLLSLPLFMTAVADLGDFAGSSDFGGSSSSSDDCDGVGWLIYYGLRLGCVIGECAESAGCSHGQVIVFEILFFGGLIGLAALVIRLRSRAGKNRTNPASVSQAPLQRGVPYRADAFDSLRAADPNFSEEDVKEKLKNLYLRLTDCRQSGDLAPIKPYLSDELYRQTEAELAAHRDADVSEHTERLAILDAQLNGYTQQDGFDLLSARLMTRCVRYQQNRATGAIVSGSGSTERFETVTVMLARRAGVVTAPRQTGMIVKNCPFCGAPLSLNESNQCPYCDSILPAEQDDWIIRSLITR